MLPKIAAVCKIEKNCTKKKLTLVHETDWNLKIVRVCNNVYPML